jgi:hypothetical protein
MPSKLAREKAKAKLVELEKQMDEIRERLRPLSEKVLAMRADLEAFQMEVEAARLELPGDDNLRKTETIRRVIKRIVVRHRHIDAGDQARSALIEVRIEPVEGAEKVYPIAADNPSRRS